MQTFPNLFVLLCLELCLFSLLLVYPTEIIIPQATLVGHAQCDMKSLHPLHSSLIPEHKSSTQSRKKLYFVESHIMSM